MPKSQAPSNRRRAMLVLGLLGVLGFGGGAIANQVVKRFLALPEDAELPVYEDAPVAEAGPGGRPGGPEGGPLAPGPDEPFRPSSTRTLTEKQYADVILRRNIFDSTAVFDPNAAQAGDQSGECKSDANVRLLATVVADSPSWSSALISIGASRDAKTDGYAVGDELSGEGRITLIEQKKVCMDGGTCICIGGDKPKGVAAAGKGEASGEGVSKQDDTHFTVDRSVIAEGIANFDQLATQMRVVPHKGTDGQVDGFRLSAIRRGSLFDKLGIKNGDIVHGVNGNPLTSTEAAMSVYQQLQNESSFTFEISRRNQRQTMEYTVR